MGKGYLKFILRMHNLGWSWDGDFSEMHMFIVFVDATMEFMITLPDRKNFIRERGIADYAKYCNIIAPHYKSHEGAETAAYFDHPLTDCMMMPDHDPDNPEPFDNFQNFIGEHMCWKAPLV